MAATWVTLANNWHCPTGDQPLIDRGTRLDVLGRPGPTYAISGTVVCQDGHLLPSEEALDAYRDQHGYPQGGAGPRGPNAA